MFRGALLKEIKSRWGAYHVTVVMATAHPMSENTKDNRKQTSLSDINHFCQLRIIVSYRNNKLLKIHSFGVNQYPTTSPTSNPRPMTTK
jgi:hypothetical protein